MVSKVKSIGLFGLEGYEIEVETDMRIADSLSIEIVGLPDTAVKEAAKRVKSALFNTGNAESDRELTLNLAPAGVKKEGAHFDLAMLLGILVQYKRIKPISPKTAFIGELSFAGEIRPCNGILAAVISAKELGFEKIYVPAQNAAEGAVTEGIEVYGVSTVDEVIDCLNGVSHIAPAKPRKIANDAEPCGDFSDIVGQYAAKRACEIAAAGGHNMLFIGPPGAGKSMLAKALPSILPDLSFDETVECSKIYSVAGLLSESRPLITRRPFVKTSQGVSLPGLIGGGEIPMPGIVSLAHNGVLFLDEVAQFGPATLNSLRQPLEDNTVTISRVKRSLTYPASFMLVCAMNPCPCGKYGQRGLQCTCTKAQIEKYLSRISGPLLDRIDLQIELPSVPLTDIKTAKKAEKSTDIKKRVDKARAAQAKRYAGLPFNCNAKIDHATIVELTKTRMTDSATKVLEETFSRLSLSMRAYDKIIKIAQTIADLSESDTIEADHITEAVFYRCLDKKYFK